MIAAAKVSVAYETLEGCRLLALTFHGVTWEEVLWVDYLLKALGAAGVEVLVDTREPPDTTSMTLDSEETFRIKVWIGETEDRCGGSGPERTRNGGET